MKETQSLANRIQLSQLRRGEIIVLGEQRTGILHIRIEHRFEKISRPLRRLVYREELGDFEAEAGSKRRRVLERLVICYEKRTVFNH